MKKRQSWKWCYSNFAFNSSHFLQILCQFPTSLYVKLCFQNKAYSSAAKPHIYTIVVKFIFTRTPVMRLPPSVWFLFLDVVYLLNHYCHSARARLQQLVPRSFSEAQGWLLMRDSSGSHLQHKLSGHTLNASQQLSILGGHCPASLETLPKRTSVCSLSPISEPELHVHDHPERPGKLQEHD